MSFVLQVANCRGLQYDTPGSHSNFAECAVLLGCDTVSGSHTRGTASAKIAVFEEIDNMIMN